MGMETWPDFWVALNLNTTTLLISISIRLSLIPLLSCPLREAPCQDPCPFLSPTTKIRREQSWVGESYKNDNQPRRI